MSGNVEENPGPVGDGEGYGDGCGDGCGDSVVRVWVVLVICDSDEMGLVCCGEDVIKVMMSLYIIEPYRFTVKNILRQIGDVVEWKSLGIELDIDPAKLGEIDKNCRGAIGDCRMSMIEFWINSDTSASWIRLAAALEGISQNVKAQEVRELGRKEGE